MPVRDAGGPDTQGRFEPEPIPLSALTGRLVNRRDSTQRWMVAVDDASIDRWRLTSDDVDTATRTAVVDVREYEISGHNAHIILPEDYARQLDAVRELRLQAESHPRGPSRGRRAMRWAARQQMRDSAFTVDLLDRALPEDVIPHLDLLPDPTIIRAIVLRNDLNPLPRAWSSLQGTYADAEGYRYDDDITFFQKNVDATLGGELRHQWAALLGRRQPYSRGLFAAAMRIDAPGEWDGDTAWAVAIGDEMLSPTRPAFDALAERAPILAVIAADTMREARENPCNRWGGPPMYDELTRRLEFVQQTVQPRALARLVTTSGSGAGDPYARRDAVRLLVEFAQGASLANVAIDSLDLSNAAVGDDHVRPLAGMAFKDVDLSATNVQELGFLANSPVERLKLVDARRIVSSSLRPLKVLTTLTELDLRGTRIEDGAISYLSELKQLKTLDIRGTGMSLEGRLLVQQKLPDTHVVL